MLPGTVGSVPIIMDLMRTPFEFGNSASECIETSRLLNSVKNRIEIKVGVANLSLNHEKFPSVCFDWLTVARFYPLSKISL